MRTSIALLALLAPLAACEPTAQSGPFEGGDFQFTTIGVDDDCLDGAMDVIFMPEGEANDFADPIYIPGDDELPMTYTIALQDPFDDSEVTVTGDADTRVVTGVQNTGVELDPDQWPGCLVDTTIDVDLLIDGPDELSGTAYLNTSSFDEDTCPVPDDDPCDIALTLTADRL